MSQLLDSIEKPPRPSSSSSTAPTPTPASVTMSITTSNAPSQSSSTADKVTKTDDALQVKDAKDAHFDPSQGLTDYERVTTSLIAGGVAGALAKTVIAPLDRTKINFQISKNRQFSYRAAAIFLMNTYKNEGFAALYRGNSATMARVIPYAAIQFTAHEQWKKSFRMEDNPDDLFRRFLSGALAGLTATSLTYPLDLARARMAVTDKYSGYKSLRHVFVVICRCEGPKTLFRGYAPTLLGVIPYAGISFFTNDTLKREYYKLTGEKPSTMYSLLFGGVAGFFGQSTSYPLDIVRRRMQTTGVTPECHDPYLTIASTIKKIYYEEGVIHGFYKGLSMNWIKGPLAAGISFATYDHINELLRTLVHLHAR